jgi:hypothetical protein
MEPVRSWYARERYRRRVVPRPGRSACEWSAGAVAELLEKGMCSASLRAQVARSNFDEQLSQLFFSFGATIPPGPLQTSPVVLSAS